MEKMKDAAVADVSLQSKIVADIKIPPPLASQFDRPEKKEAVAKLTHRYSYRK